MIVYSVRGERELWTGFRFHGWLEDMYAPGVHRGSRPGTLDERWAKVSEGANPMNISRSYFPRAAVLAAEADLSDSEVAGGGFIVYAQGWPLRMVSYHEVWMGYPVK